MMFVVDVCLFYGDKVINLSTNWQARMGGWVEGRFQEKLFVMDMCLLRG